MCIRDRNWNNEYSYLLIGDSFAEGWCVNEKDNLQNILIRNNKKTISLGISGSGPLLQLAILQEYKLLIKPKKISIVIVLRAPAIAIGCKSSILIKTPPKLQHRAATSKNMCAVDVFT